MILQSKIIDIIITPFYLLTEEKGEDISIIEISSQNDRKEEEQVAVEPSCTICFKEVTEKFISCSDCGARLHYRCTFLPAYQLFYFVNDMCNYICVNCTPVGLL